MKLFLCALLAVALAEDPLRAVLRSPKAALNLYSQFKSANQLSFGVGEDRMRFRLFLKNAEHVADYNEDKDDTASYGINMFSSMTTGERKQYLGLNVTLASANQERDELPELAAGVGYPSSLLWPTQGAVTAVKNQGSCGSCWAFAAVGGVETRYQLASGVLRDFSEQEYLDCTYEGYRNGCLGGWYDTAWKYSIRKNGRLAAQVDYPYTNRDGTCMGSSKSNAMKAARVVGYTRVASNEGAHIAALQGGSVSVAFEVTDRFFQYDGGIIKDTSCRGQANHAVTAVGYTSAVILVKNSWGSRWGDRGFVMFTRGYSNCELYNYSKYPTLSSTGGADSGDDAAASWTDDGNNNPDPNCVDTSRDCNRYKNRCSGYSDSWTVWMAKYCKRKCGLCSDASGDCPSGTVRCNDGVCRHEHMCH